MVLNPRNFRRHLVWTCRQCPTPHPGSFRGPSQPGHVGRANAIVVATKSVAACRTLHMSITPNKPRLSAIPGPSSRLPTPGRSRSTSSASQGGTTPIHDSDFASRALADALKAHDPTRHRTFTAGDAPSGASISSVKSGSRLTPGRPSLTATSITAHNGVSSTRPKTPTARPLSRQSDAFARSYSRAGRVYDIGDAVRVESLGFEGILRYLGEIEGKPGTWAGVELSGGFAGKGKNDGSVAGYVASLGSWMLCSFLWVGRGTLPVPRTVVSSWPLQSLVIPRPVHGLVRDHRLLCLLAAGGSHHRSRDESLPLPPVHRLVGASHPPCQQPVGHLSEGSHRHPC